jgi:hypothetical protein
MIKLKDILNEGKYYVTYNKGRGQGKGLEKEFDKKAFKTTNKPKVFNSFKDAKEYAEKMEKMFRNSIGGSTAYYVSDEKMNRVEESLSEATMHNMTREKSLDNLKDVIQNIKPYSKEAVKHCEAAIAIIEKFDVR